MMPAPASVQAATIDKFIAAWKRFTPKDMLATWSDDFTQHTLPFSLGHASRTRAQVEATLPKLAQILTNYTVSLSINPMPIHLARDSTYLMHSSLSTMWCTTLSSARR